ncbi:MAG: superoxide dismutase family protein [Chloroflexota bacterium]
MAIRKRGAVVIGILAVFVFAVPAVAAHGDQEIRRATAELRNVSGEVVGRARFREDSHGNLHVDVRVRGLSEGLHGIHIHNVASCSDTSVAFGGAGSHHNPLGAVHGAHAGDLPNLVVKASGKGHLKTTTDGATLSAGPVSIFDGDGSAIVIHADEDDLVTNPTGNSGGRIACGIIVAR